MVLDQIIFLFNGFRGLVLNGTRPDSFLGAYIRTTAVRLVH